jgi:oligogalacturonide lyase
LKETSIILVGIMFVLMFSLTKAQIGTRFPSERKIIKDPFTGVELIFLTSTPAGDSKIYPTHNQWTSDGEWVIFRSARVKNEAMAVNEKSGEIIQVTEGGYRGTLNVARKSMKLYFMRKPPDKKDSQEIVEVNLAGLFADSKAGTLKPAPEYQRVCGTIPPELEASGDMALDADEEWIWFSVGRDEAMKHLAEDTKIEENFGPRNMGEGPGGIAGINIQTGKIKYVVSVPFRVGHIQSNPWVPGQIVFCWETGGKSPQRTWIVNSDGTGLRPLYPEAPYEWVTHEVVISPDEVAFSIMAHRKIPGTFENVPAGTDVHGSNPGQEIEWGSTGNREKPTGLAIVNIKTREMIIAGQIPYGSGFWHVAGSSDGRFAAGDNFAREIYLIDRHSHEMILLSAGHKPTARDHPHPTFSPDGTKILIQSAMLSEDGKSMNICIIPVPKEWLKRKYE